MSNAKNIVTVDRVTGVVSCQLGRWYQRDLTCVVTVAADGTVEVVAGGMPVGDWEDRAGATRDALVSICAHFMAVRS